MKKKFIMPSKIKLKDWGLQKKAGVYLLKTPHMNRCSGCRQYQLAIAAMPASNPKQTHFKWFCKTCARDLGIQPTQELLRKLPTMNTLHIQYRKGQIRQLQNVRWVRNDLEECLHAAIENRAEAVF